MRARVSRRAYLLLSSLSDGVLYEEYIVVGERGAYYARVSYEGGEITSVDIERYENIHALVLALCREYDLYSDVIEAVAGTRTREEATAALDTVLERVEIGE